MSVARTILIVEDADEDYEVVSTALMDDAPEGLIVRRASDGEAAWSYLQAAEAGQEGAPDLILLDVNLPGISGHDVLRRLKASDDLRVIPVVMLSALRHTEAVDAAYASGASSYIRKPADFDGLYDVVARLRGYWLNTVELPRVL